MQIGGSNMGATAMARMTPQRRAEQMMTEMDGDQNGSISKDEFTQAAKVHQASRSGQSERAAPDPAAVFQQLDVDSSTGLSLQELTELAAPGGPGRKGGAGPPPGGPGPAGPPSGGKTASEVSLVTSESTETEVADPADSNQDGEVSEEERLAYELAQASSSYQAVSQTSVEVSASVAL